MKKYSGFKVVSIVYIVLAVLMITLSIFSFIDYSKELGILGHHDSYYDAYTGYFGFLTGVEDNRQFINIGGYIFLALGSIIFVPLLISLIMVIVSSKNGTTKKGHFVPAVVLGGLLSFYFLGLPLLITSILSMSKINNDIVQTNEHKSNKTGMLITSIILLIFAVILLVFSFAIPNLTIRMILSYVSYPLFAIGLVLLIVAIVLRKKASTKDVLHTNSKPLVLPESNDEIHESVYSFGNKIEVKEEKSRTNMAGFIIVTIIYAVILILSIISLFGVRVLWENLTLNKVTGGWLIAFLGSYGLYFFMLSPFKTSDKVKKIGVLSSIGAILLLDVLPIVLVAVNYSTLSTTKDGSMFKLFNDGILIIISMLVSEIGIIGVYLLSQAKLDPNKFKKEAPKDDHKDSFLVMLLKTLLQIIIGLFNSAVALIKLRDKHVNVFAVLVSLLFSFLCVVLAEVMAILLIIMIVGVVILLVGKFISWAYIESTKYEAEIKDEYGNAIKVHQYSYMGDYWEDDFGNRYKQNGLDSMIKE